MTVQRRLQQQVSLRPIVVIFSLADGQLSDYELQQSSTITELENCINDQRDVSHFESYFHNRTLK